MKHRIALWASAGFLVAGCWALYAIATGPSGQIYSDPIIWTLLGLSCPVAVSSYYFHFPISLHAVLLVNAATYALVGLIVESVVSFAKSGIVRRHLRHP